MVMMGRREEIFGPPVSKDYPTFLFTFVEGPISEVEYRLWFMGGDVILLACLLAFLGFIFKFYALRFYVFISLTFSSSSRFTFSSLESCVIGVILYIFLHSILAYNPQSPPIQPNILIYSTHIPPAFLTTPLARLNSLSKYTSSIIGFYPTSPTLVNVPS